MSVATPNEAPKGDPVLRLVVEVDGKPVMPPIQVRVPYELSLRIAGMHLTEMLGKVLKGNVPAMLKGMGFK